MDSGTQTSNSRQPTLKYLANALNERGEWRAVVRVQGSYNSVDCDSCAGFFYDATLDSFKVNTAILEAITFQSDHGVIRDYTTDFEKGGNPFPEPEWVSSAWSRPISHTMDVECTVRCRLIGAPGSYRLRGQSSTQVFPETAVTIDQSGVGFVTITTSTRMPQEINRVTLAITWELLAPFQQQWFVLSTEASQTDLYLTADAPIEQGDLHVATLRRMQRAVAAASSSNTLDSATMLRRVMGSIGEFNPAAGLPNAWYAPDPVSARPRGMGWPNEQGADCQTIVRYGKKVLWMVGLGSNMTIEHVNVFAIETAPTQAIEKVQDEDNFCNCNAADAADCYWDLCRPPCKLRSHPLHPDWKLQMNTNPNLNSEGGANCFEACAKVTMNGVTKYYPGGVLVTGSNPKEVVEKSSANDVLKVFYSLAWFKDDKPVQHVHVYNP